MYDHKFDEPDDFISQTIKSADELLRGERQDQQRAVRQSDEWDAESLAAYDEWSREVSEQTDAYFDTICGAHGDERGENGPCPQCEQELAQERIDDK